MPLVKKEDYALGDESSLFCVHCVNADGSLKSGDEIFEGGVQFFQSSLGGERALAERITRTNMSRLPYWQERPFDKLRGEMASDSEFRSAMERL